MDFGKFYDIITYVNRRLKGDFTPKEMATNANNYYEAFRYFSGDETIIGLLALLLEDASNGSEEALAYAKEIVDGLSD